MSRYLVARLLAIIPVFVTVSVLAFALQALSPGDPARLLLEASGLNPVPPEAVAAKRLELRLDDPLPVRYLNWLRDALGGDFGRSYRSYRPVTELYLDRFPATLALAGTAVVVSASLALPLGVIAAYQRGRPLDMFTGLIAVTGAAVPGFWLSFIAVWVFSVKLSWLPAFGSLTLRGIILPAAVLALAHAAILTRLARAATLDVLTQEFVLVARAKGLSRMTLVRRHILPNVLVPVLTVLGLELAGLITGGAVVEYVFAWPGIGKMAVDAALQRDIPVVVGFAVAAALVFVSVNLVVDLICAVVDPRARSV